MTCSPGDIAAIPFPYSDLTTRKKRPVLVITKPDRYGDFVGLAVTSVLMEDEEKAQLLPENVLLIFEVEGEEDFNRWHRELSLRNREVDQPITVVHLKKWRIHSVIEDMTLTQASA